MFISVMLKTPAPLLRTGLLALLLPVLLLLPAFHTHPEQRHTHGHDSAHSHPAVVHADFFAISAHEHDAHDQGHATPEESSSPSDFHTSLFTLLPRSLVLLAPALERMPLAFLTARLVITSLPVNPSWMYSSEHPPPIQSSSFPAISPRSPPRLA